MFNYVLDTHGLKLDQDGQPRTTYSLRHYALQTRLNKSGGKVDIYDFARNAGSCMHFFISFPLETDFFFAIFEFTYGLSSL